MLAERHAGLGDEPAVRLLEPGAVLVGLVEDDLANARLDRLLGAAEARAQRRVERAAVRGVAVAGGHDDRVLLGVDADAGVVAGAGRGVRGAARAAAVAAVGDTHRRAVVAGGDDRFLDHDEGADPPADAVRSRAHRPRDPHVVLVPARPLEGHLFSAPRDCGFLVARHGRGSSE